MRAILHSVLDGIITFDEDGVITSANPTSQDLFGYIEGTLIGMNIKTMAPEPLQSNHEDYLALFQSTESGKAIGEGRHLAGLAQDERRSPIEVRIARVSSHQKKECVGVICDISEQIRIEEHLTRLAMVDGLSGLANRRRLDEVLARESPHMAEFSSSFRAWLSTRTILGKDSRYP